MTRNVCKQRFSLAAMAVCVLFSIAAGPQVSNSRRTATLTDATTYSIHYFKEKRPLTLDLTRVAILREGGVASSDIRGLGLNDLGLNDREVEKWPLGNWVFVATDASQRTPQDIARNVARVANRAAVNFVSPVFVGSDGGPMLMRPFLLVGFDKGITPARREAILNRENAGDIQVRDLANMPGAYKLRIRSRNGFELLAAANRLAKRADVLWAEPDMMFSGRAGLIPNDSFFGDVWGVHNTGQSGGQVDADMDGPEAWDITTGDPSIKVVIIDTGVLQTHVDINQIPGADTTVEGPGDGGPVNVCDVHGTWVAGCVSAKINNNEGTVGICPDCTSVSVRTFVSLLACNGNWNSGIQETLDALAFADGIGAQVTNNSNLYGFSSASIDALYTQLRDDGMVHFASAGNGGVPFSEYPATIPSVNSIAAMNRFNDRAGFSQWGPDIFISAPGEDILTTDVGGGYAFVNGTSFASPYSAGVAGLLLSVNPNFSAVDVETIMATAADDLGDPGRDDDFGWGFVNAHRTLLVADPLCELGELFTSAPTAGGSAGSSVAIGFGVLVVGAPDHAPAGAAYVYERVGISWSQVAILTPSDGASTTEQFGSAIAISSADDTVVVGAPGNGNGAAYVFVKPVTTSWTDATEDAKLVATGLTSGASFGASVSISDSSDTLCVGAPGQNGSGSTYVYERSGAWTAAVQDAELTASDAASGDDFGASVSISFGGEVIAVGAPQDNSTTGSAYVYVRPGANWGNTNETAKLTASDGASGHELGISVEMDEDITSGVGTILAGAPGANGGVGTAYVFGRPVSGWVDGTQTAILTPSDGGASDGFGASVSFTFFGSVVVGAPSHDGDAGVNQGAAYVYGQPVGGWVDMTENLILVASNPGAGDLFGSSVSIRGAFDGSTVTSVSGANKAKVPPLPWAVIGAPGNTDTAGAGQGSAHAFDLGFDCNGTNVPDTCDILRGISEDFNGNFIPDECECIIPDQPQTDVVAAGEPRNRYLAILPPSPGLSTALRVTVSAVPAGFESILNDELWVSNPTRLTEASGSSGDSPEPTFLTGGLQCSAQCADWGALGEPIYVFAPEIIPNATYTIQAIACSPGCSQANPSAYSTPLNMTQSIWGDAVPEVGTTDFLDIQELVKKFKNTPDAISKSRADIAPELEPDGLVDFKDIQNVVEAFKGAMFPNKGVAGCP